MEKKMLNNLKLWQKMTFGAAVPLILMGIFGYISISSLNTLSESSHLVNHTHEVIQEAMKIEGAAVDMETGMRGYLLAGKDDFLGPYKSGQVAFDKLVKDLKKTVSDNPSQVALLGEIKVNISGWLKNVTEPAIALRRKIGDAKTMDDMADEVAKAKGKEYFDKFRAQIATFIKAEEELMSIRQEDALKTSKEGEITINNLSKNASWVNHTHKAIQEAMKIEAAAVDMETGMRGYLLSGKEEFLEPYKHGKERFGKLLSSLQNLVSDNIVQVGLLKETQENIANWNKEVTEPAIALRREVVAGTSKIDDVVTLVSQGKGKKYFDKFRGQIAKFISAESELMAKRKADADLMSSKTSSNLKELQKTSYWVNHTHEVIQEAMKVEAAAVNMETGVRGYLLAGKKSFLDPYNSGQKDFSKTIKKLQTTVSDNPAQVELLGQIEKTINDWVSNEVSKNIALREAIGDAKTMNDMAKLVGEARGKTYFDKFRGQIKSFIDVETGLMEKRQITADATTLAAEKTIFLGTVATVIASFVIFFFLTVAITRPMNAIAHNIRDIAEGEGDLTKRVQVSSKDEIGEVGNWFNQFIDKLHNIISEVQQGSNTLAKQTQEVATNSRSISSSVGTMNDQAGTVSTASKAMYENIVEMALEVETMNENTYKVSKFSENIAETMNVVAASVEESQISLSSIAGDSVAISKQISNIVAQTDEGQLLSSEAVKVVNSANEKIGKLDEASQEISKVVELIIEIAEQTKSLALNATIEAARAGEAGKGFAVVANEVKELAKQTNDATSLIQERIDAIKGSTEETIVEIKEVGGTIFKLNEIVVAISSSINDQKEKVNSSSAASTQAADVLMEIAKNITEVNQGVSEINHEMSSLATSTKNFSVNMQENKSQTSQVSDNMAEINSSLGENSSSISGISQTAENMAGKAGELQTLVDRFIV